MIVHRCVRCGHPDTFHGGGRDRECSYGACRCSPSYGPPELIPTWDADVAAHGEPVTDVLPPGGQLARIGPTSCACDDCQALYDELMMGTR